MITTILLYNTIIIILCTILCPSKLLGENNDIWKWNNYTCDKEPIKRHCIKTIEYLK